MQHFRKITSLSEDFEALGLVSTKLDESQFFPRETPDPELIDEALRVQRTQKMSPADKAKARRYRQKNKSKLARQKTVRERKPQFQKNKEKHARLKGDRTAGPRRRFVLTQENTSAMRLKMKKLEELRKLHNANSPVKVNRLLKTLLQIRENAQVLSRKFAVLEEIKYGFLKESAIPVEHPGSEYGWENPDAPNINAGNKVGDATDYSKDSKLKGNVKEDDMDPSDNQEWWTDVDSSDDECDDGSDGLDSDDSDSSFDDADFGDDDLSDDDLSDDDLSDDEIELDFDLPDDEEKADEDLKEEGEENSEDDEKELPESKSFKRIDLSYEMAKLRTESEEVFSKLKTSVLSPSDAASVVSDMVVYLGGAMKAYIDLAAQISKQYQQGGYVGQGDLAASEGSPEDSKTDKRYVGKDDPADAVYKLDV
jgi:hypothetical protein